MFKNGRRYTRREIGARVGGDLQSYLPNVGGRVAAACLDPNLNPDAPAVILPGIGPRIEGAADLLLAQGAPVPTFLKRGTNEWEYVGEFRAEHGSRDASELTTHARRSGRSDITRVIHMTEVKAPPGP
jgi:hypothetical protein